MNSKKRLASHVLCYQDTVKIPSCGYGSGNIDDPLQFLELLEFSGPLLGRDRNPFSSGWFAIELGDDAVIFTRNSYLQTVWEQGLICKQPHHISYSLFYR